ncbi:MAG: hypothetical protein K2X03_08130 [Bryobacteraceae bacterium]|nr:hypothetical protein [Bryobacteraceae bacterium]
MRLKLTLRNLCLFSFFAALPLAGQVTYAREVSRIVQEKCQQCHRPNDIAPFALSTYDDAVTWAEDIKRVVSAGIMPPWKPVAGHGEFRDSFALTDQEKRDLLAWIDGGTPLGDEANMPAAPPEKGEWSLGEPDLTVRMAESFTPVRGRDTYRCFVLPTGLDADKYVSAIDVVPGNRQSVHHVILYLDSTGKAEELDKADEGPGYNCLGGPGTPIAGNLSLADLGNLASALSYTLGGWAPGTRAHLLPDGVGIPLSKNARIVMQVHYYTNVSRDPDQTRVGIYFSKTKVEKPMFFLPVVQQRLNIPPGAAEHTESTNFVVPFLLDNHVINVFPHMHLLGREIKMEMIRAGSTTPMVLIDQWDFNWQGPYTYTKPMAVPAGSTVRLSCKYDNSANNPRNPSNPPKRVTWGEGTEDEMCVAFLGVTLDRFSPLF